VGVISLWNEAIPDDPAWNEPALIIERKMKVQPELFIVAVDTDSISGDVVAGTVIAGFDGFRGWLHHISVAKLYQSQGIARSMIEKALEELSRLGCPKVNLQVRADNHAVAGFYEQLGFTREERASFGINLTNRH